MYAHEDLTNKIESERLQRRGMTSDLTEDMTTADCTIGEIVPGLGRYLEVKAIVERNLGQKVSHNDMDILFTELLKEMPHEKRCKKQYGDDSHYYWRTREYNKLKAEGKING